MQRNVIILVFVAFVLLFGGILLSTKRQKQLVVSGSPTTTPSSVKNIPEPTRIPTETAPEANIIVYSPKSGDTVALPLIITGKGRVFENQLNYRIKDDKGNLLSKGNTYANALDAGQYGPFTITISDLGEFTKGQMVIEVFDYSAKDGSEVDKVTIPVTLQ